MEYVWKVLVLAPATSLISLAIFFAALLISSGFFRNAGSGIGLHIYAVLTALIVVPYILFVIYVFLMAAPVWTFSEAIGMLTVSLLLSPLGAGWILGMAIGGTVRAVRRPREGEERPI